MKNFKAYLLLLLIFSNYSYCHSIFDKKTLRRNLEDLPHANGLSMNAYGSSLIKMYYFEGNAIAKKMVESTRFRSKDDSIFFKEITFAGQKLQYERQAGLLVLNLQGKDMPAQSTVLDLLENTPGVSVDPHKNVLNMKGKDSVVFMVNGKHSHSSIDTVIQKMKTLHANNIEKIEISTKPAANYKVEGNAGIINIVLKENNEYGISGNFSLGLGYGKLAKSGSHFNINYRSKKINVLAGYSFLANHSWKHASLFQFKNNQSNITGFTGAGDSKTFKTTHNARLGFDYEISRKTFIGASFSGYDSRLEGDAYYGIDLLENTEVTAHMGMKKQELNHRLHAIGNFNLSHSFDPGTILTLDVDKLYYHSEYPMHFVNSFENLRGELYSKEEIKATISNQTDILVAQLGYLRTFNTKAKFEIGVKGNISNTVNTFLIENLMEDEWAENRKDSDKYNSIENIGAAYANFHHQIADIKLQAGLRWEYAYTAMEDDERNKMIYRQYKTLLPELSLQKDLGKRSELRASFGRKIARPGYADLAPYLISFDQFTYLSGNTVYQPVITDVVQAGLSFMDNNKLIFQYDQDRYYTDQFTLPYYITKVNNISLALCLPISLGSGWKMRNDIIGIRQQYASVYEGNGINIKGQNIQLATNQNISITSDISLEVSAIYRSTRHIGLGAKQPTASFNLGIEKKFSNNRGNISLTVTDFLWTSINAVDYKHPQLNVDQGSKSLSEPKVIRLSYTRNFGNRNVKPLKKRISGSEEGQSRIPEI